MYIYVYNVYICIICIYICIIYVLYMCIDVYISVCTSEVLPATVTGYMELVKLTIKNI